MGPCMKISISKYIALFTTAFLIATSPASADSTAAKINIVVGISAGGLADTVARLVADMLPEHLGAQVTVINQPGAGGSIAYQHVARAAPDGTTILATNMDPLLIRALSDDSSPGLEEFRLVGVVANAYQILYASSKHGWTSLKDFVDAARKDPGRYSVGVMLGASQAISLRQLQKIADLSLIEVPFKGFSEIRQNVAGGHVDLSFDTAESVLDETKFRILAVRALNRLPEMPNVPTFKESGIDLFPFLGTYVFLVPKDTPDDIAERLTRAIGTVAASPAFKERMRGMGFQPMEESLADYVKRLSAEKSTYRMLVETYMPKTK
jgi:tripartite-type tricarboxylate transporter receptor subunit TctC